MIDLTNFLLQHPALFVTVLFIGLLGSVLDLIQFSFLVYSWKEKRRKNLYEKVKKELLYEQFELGRTKGQRNENIQNT